jgi:hypothetical protein
MGKAYEAFIDALTFKNEATTTIPAYAFVRLCTTNNSVDIITTRGTVAPIGISQEAINPSDNGKVALSGVSRLKMASTGFTTMYVTTPMQIGSAANGRGVVLTTSTTLEMGARGLSTFAASDIVTVVIANSRPVYRT